MKESMGIWYKIAGKDLHRSDVDWSEIYGKVLNRRVEPPTIYIFVNQETDNVFVCRTKIREL